MTASRGIRPFSKHFGRPMSYQGHRNNPVLGPCPCTVCRKPLYWAEKTTRYHGKVGMRLAWREATGYLHRCRGAVE